MILVRHMECEWQASLLEWDALPSVTRQVEGRNPKPVVFKTCPKCGYNISAARLEYAGTETTWDTLERIDGPIFQKMQGQ